MVAPALAAQGTTVRGQLRRGRADTAGTTPLAGHWVTLHRVDRQGGAPVDSQRTDRRGRFRFPLAVPDTGAIYFVGTEWQTIAYLTTPMRGAALPDSTETLLVWDTTRTGPPIVVAQRHVVVRSPGPDGRRRVLELVVLEHRGTGTRVGNGAAGPVWSGRLPAGAAAFEVGESDMSAEAVRARNGTVEVLAPLPPGERQLLYTYQLPGGAPTLSLGVIQPIERLTLLLEDTTAAVESGPVADRGIEVFEDAQFRMFDGAVPAQAGIVIRYNRPRTIGENLLAAIVVGALVVLGVAIVLVRRAQLAKGAPRP